MHPGSAASLALARACLDEDARVVIFGPVAASGLRELRWRAPFRVQAHQLDPGPAARDEAICAAISWGGAPYGVIARAPIGSRDNDGAAWARACASRLPPGGRLLVLREETAEPVQEAQAVLRRSVVEDHRRGVELAGRETRVSALGWFAGPSGSGVAPRGLAAEPAVPALAVFLIGRGAGQVVVVSPEGAVQMG